MPVCSTISIDTKSYDRKNESINPAQAHPLIGQTSAREREIGRDCRLNHIYAIWIPRRRNPYLCMFGAVCDVRVCVHAVHVFIVHVHQIDSFFHFSLPSRFHLCWLQGTGNAESTEPSNWLSALSTFHFDSNDYLHCLFSSPSFSLFKFLKSIKKEKKGRSNTSCVPICPSFQRRFDLDNNNNNFIGK